MKLNCKVNAGILKNMINSLKIISEECTIHIDENEMKCAAMDHSHVMLGTIRLDAHSCESYSCTEAGDIGLYVDDTAKIVKRFNDKDTVEISIENEDSLHFRSNTKKFKVRLIHEPLVQDVPRPKLTFTNTVKVNRAIMRDVLADMVAAGADAIFFEPTMSSENVKTLVCAGGSDAGRATRTLSEADLIPIKFDEFNTVQRAAYSLDYLKEMFDVIAYDNMLIQFSDNQPILIKSANDLIEFMLSPRVQN